MKRYYTKIEIDGRCVNLLLTEEEVFTAYERAIEDVELNGINESFYGVCWPTEHPPKCSFWDKLLGKCDCETKRNNNEQS